MKLLLPFFDPLLAKTNGQILTSLPSLLVTHSYADQNMEISTKTSFGGRFYLFNPLKGRDVNWLYFDIQV